MNCRLIKWLLPDISYLWLVSWLIVADDATQGQEGRMFAFYIFDCRFAHLLTTKHRPRSLVEEKFYFSAYVLIFRRESGRESKGVVFTTTLILRSKFNPHPGHVVAALDKSFYDDYCCMAASKKQQIQWAIIRKNSQEHWKLLVLSRCGFVQERITATAIKSVRIVQ